MKKNLVLLVAITATCVCCLFACVVTTQYRPQDATAPAPEMAAAPAQEEYVAPPPMTFGEPIYYPPPFAVSYRYDHYFYERSGGFVNVVFISGGVRHVEVWRSGGVRMTPEQYNRWRVMPEHRINRVAIEQHRTALETRHGIKHPDTFYGVRPRPAQPGRPAPARAINPSAPAWGQQPPPMRDQRQPQQVRDQRQPAPGVGQPARDQRQLQQVRDQRQPAPGVGQPARDQRQPQQVRDQRQPPPKQAPKKPTTPATEQAPVK